MKNKLKVFLRLLFLQVILVSCGGGEHAPLVPVEDFFRNPEKTAFQISPDGSYISFLQPYRDRMNIFVQTVDGRNVRRLTSEANFNISFYFWANNREIVYVKDNSTDDCLKLFAVNRDGRNFRQLLSEKNVRLKFINQNNIVNNQLLIALNKRDSTIFDAYRLNVNTGRLEIAGKNPGNIFHWIADEQGRLRLALAGDGVNETLLFRNKEDEPFRPVITNSFKNKIYPVGFCSDRTDCIYALSNLNRDKVALVKMNCSTGKETSVIFRHDSVDVSEAGYLPQKHMLLYAGYETWKKQRYYLNDSLKAIYTRLEQLLPNNEIRIADQDTARNNFIVKTFTDRSPGAFYLYNRSEGRLTKLSEINPSIQPEEMCRMTPVSFKTKDNFTINGYLTIPLGYKPRNLPVVVIPHGGPSGRDSWGFDSEVQFLANRGYAVFQLNFRGSKGYGKKFWIAGFKKWGSDIQDDITAGVNWLISEGIADRNRIAIYGTGFGGFSALFGLCFHPSLYRCGASQSGFVNLFTYIRAVPPYYKPKLQMFYEIVGNPEKEMDYFRSVSPVFHTDKIKTPVLIAQAVRDPRVNINETNQFVKELKNRKVPVSYIVTENRPGSESSPEAQIRFYHSLGEFFKSNLKK